MRFIPIPIFAVITSLVAVVIAKPVPNRVADGIAIPLARHPSSLISNKTIDLDAIVSHGISVRDKILRGLDNHERNTGTMHPFAVERNKSELGRRDGAGLPLTSFQDTLWMAEISLGTPPKTFKVTIDTGAADMWVLQTGCAGISADRNLWKPRASTSAKNLRKQFLFEYADGSIVKGGQYKDRVTIAGFTAKSQIFGSATSFTSTHPWEYPADGLMGLAFPSAAGLGGTPLLESLVRQNRLTKATLSFKLSPSGAEMYVGGANRLLYSGDIAYTPVVTTGLWQVVMEDMRVNGNIIFKSVPSLFDTGASHIFGDWDRVAELHKRLDGTLEERGPFAFYHIPCNSPLTLSFTFGGKTFDIASEELTFKKWEDSEGSSIDACVSSIIGSRSHDASWVIGSTFLQGVYSVFDYSTSQVGFADLA